MKHLKSYGDIKNVEKSENGEFTDRNLREYLQNQLIPTNSRENLNVTSRNNVNFANKFLRSYDKMRDESGNSQTFTSEYIRKTRSTFLTKFWVEQQKNI